MLTIDQIELLKDKIGYYEADQFPGDISDKEQESLDETVEALDIMKQKLNHG